MKKKAATKKKGGGRGNRRGPNFTDEEYPNLLDLAKEDFPVGGTKWELLAEKHMKGGYPDCGAGALKKQHNKLAQKSTQIPTRDSITLT